MITGDGKCGTHGPSCRARFRVGHAAVRCFVPILAVAIGAMVPCRGADDITFRIEERVIKDFCEAVFPIRLKGRKRVGITVLGKSVSQEVPWTAIVRSPRIKISRAEQAFVADVEVEASGLKWKGDVAGKLEARYDTKDEAIVISVADAVVPVTVGPLTIDIDVAKEVPELPFAFPVPQITLPTQGKKVRVVTDPEIGFDDGVVVVSSKVSFKTESERRTRAAESRDADEAAE